MPPAFPEPSCSYRLRDTDTDRSIFHSPCPPQSPPKIAAGPLALPPAVDLVRTSAPAQNDLERCFRMFIATPVKVLRRAATTLESAQYTSEQFQRLMANNGVDCSMCRSGNVWDNAAMESFFSSLKTERIGRKVYRTRDAARADVFDYIERFYNTIRRRLDHLATSARLSSKGRSD